MSNKKVMIGFKTDPEIKAQLEQIAYAEDRTLSYIVNRIIAKGIKDYGKSTPLGPKARAGESKKKAAP